MYCEYLKNTQKDRIEHQQTNHEMFKVMDMKVF